VVKVITIDGGLLEFLGASYSGSMFSVLVASVSISVVLRGEKKL
jgi:hypothetical protein